MRESPRAKLIRLTIRPRRPLDLVVPRRVGDAEIGRFLESRRRWIEANVARARAAAVRPPQLRLERRGAVQLLGETLPVERRNGRRAVAELRDGVLRVAGPDAAAAAALERWYRREARRRIAELVEREAGRLGLEVKAIAIRDQRSRWGSCSTRGTLSFSWRLLLAPAEILEYVVVHELCHLREPNHSKAFWRQLEAVRPGWRAQAHWLREHGSELSAFRPAAALP